MKLENITHNLKRHKHITMVGAITIMMGVGLYQDISFRNQTSFKDINEYRTHVINQETVFNARVVDPYEIINKRVGDKEVFMIQAFGRNTGTNAYKVMTQVIERSNVQKRLSQASQSHIEQSELKYVVLAEVLNPSIAEQLVKTEGTISLELVHKEGLTDLTFTKMTKEGKKSFSFKEIRLGGYKYFLL